MSKKGKSLTGKGSGKSVGGKMKQITQSKRAGLCFPGRYDNLFAYYLKSCCFVSHNIIVGRISRFMKKGVYARNLGMYCILYL